MFETRREQQLDWPQLTERLRAHLGDAAVRQLAIVAEHRPERAWSFGATQASIPGAISGRRPVSAAARDAIQGIARAQRLRPLWLLPRALPLRGPAPRILAGPERIESGWWDGADARRDYYIVRTRDGQRAWAYLPAGAMMAGCCTVVRMKRRDDSPHRFGRQARINEHPREIGEPSQRRNASH